MRRRQPRTSSGSSSTRIRGSRTRSRRRSSRAPRSSGWRKRSRASWCRSSGDPRRSSSSTTRWSGCDERVLGWGGPMKKVQAVVKLQIPAGKANPSPPVGPALGQHGVNIMEFCKGFNAQTGREDGLILPVVVTIFQDRSFTFIVKTPPAAVLLKRAAGIAKASAVPHKDKIGKVTRQQVRDIAQTKLVDLNTSSIDAAMRIIEGTARSMGIDVVERG